jgi:hypothetical protein
MRSGRPNGVERPTPERRQRGQYRKPVATGVKGTIDSTDPMEPSKGALGGRAGYKHLLSQVPYKDMRSEKANLI